MNKKSWTVQANQRGHLPLFTGKIAADQKDADAQSNYARCLANGKRAERDDAEASRYYKLAADHVTAPFIYVSRLLNGEEVEKDETETARYSKMAADQDDDDAQRAYGECFEDGSIVSKDITEALRYHELAVASGGSSVQDDVDRCQQLPRSTANGGLRLVQLELMAEKTRLSRGSSSITRPVENPCELIVLKAFDIDLEA
jgi:hypothetical protein